MAAAPPDLRHLSSSSPYGIDNPRHNLCLGVIHADRSQPRHHDRPGAPRRDRGHPSSRLRSYGSPIASPGRYALIGSLLTRARPRRSANKEPPGRINDPAGRRSVWVLRLLQTIRYSACASKSPGQMPSARETLPSKSALNFSRMAALTFRYSLSLRICAVVISTGSRTLIETP